MASHSAAVGALSPPRFSLARRVVSCWAFGLLLALGVGPAWADEGWTRAYARVDGVAVLRTAVDAEAKGGVPKYQVLQRHLTMAVMRAALLKADCDPSAVSESELDAAMQEADEALKSRGGNLEAILKRSGQTRDEFREDLRLPLAFRGLVRKGISDETLAAEFEHKKVLLGGEARICHLLVAIKQGRSRVQARALAETLRKELGPEPTKEAFTKLASARSDEPMASLTGGDLDWARATDRRRELSPHVLRAALTRGKVGLVDKVVDGQQGVHLVFVSQVRVPAGVTFERYRDQLRAGLESSEAQRLMLNWREAAKIEYAPDAPRSPPSKGGAGRAPGSLRRGK